MLRVLRSGLVVVLLQWKSNILRHCAYFNIPYDTNSSIANSNDNSIIVSNSNGTSSQRRNINSNWKSAS